jgi:hypothetical protein
MCNDDPIRSIKSSYAPLLVHILKFFRISFYDHFIKLGSQQFFTRALLCKLWVNNHMQRDIANRRIRFHCTCECIPGTRTTASLGGGKQTTHWSSEAAGLSHTDDFCCRGAGNTECKKTLKKLKKVTQS